MTEDSLPGLNMYYLDSYPGSFTEKKRGLGTRLMYYHDTADTYYCTMHTIVYTDTVTHKSRIRLVRTTWRLNFTLTWYNDNFRIFHPHS